MISVEGASVLAQVIPVGLLVVAFEARRGERLKVAPGLRTVLLWSGRVIVAAVILFATFVESTCIAAVSSEAAIRGHLALLVYVGAYALAAVVFTYIFSAVMDNVGITEGLAERARRKNGA